MKLTFMVIGSKRVRASGDPSLGVDVGCVSRGSYRNSFGSCHADALDYATRLDMIKRAGS